MKRTLLLLLPVLCLGLSGCRRKTPVPAGDAGAPAAAKPSPLQLSLTTDKTTYKSGETIKFTLTARNASKAPVQVTFTSGQKYDIEARNDANGALAWRWSEGRMFTQIFREETWQPGETRRYEDTWNARTSNPDGSEGAPIAAGRYVLRAELSARTPDAKRTLSLPVTVEVGP